MSPADAAPSPTESPEGAAAPDWSTLDIELHCPRCGYNLKMLTSPRCPECGLTFEWDELIRATRNELHVPIFEYQWRTRPIRSFFGTILRCMFPWTLWRRIPLAAPVRFGPIGVFVFLAFLFFGIATCGITLIGGAALALTRTVNSASWLPAIRGRINYELEWAAVVVSLVAIAVAGLFIFFQTLGRARVRARHLVRIAVYSFVTVLIWQFAIETVITLTWAVSLFLRISGSPFLIRLPTEDLAVLMGLVSIADASRHYLQIQKPELVTLVIAGLMLLGTLVLILCASAHYGSFQNQVSDAIRPGIPATCQALIDAVCRWR